MSTATTQTGKALSQKIRWLLESMGKSAVARLARACKVKAPSVYTWRDKGQVDKRHIPTFAALSGTRLAWWLEPNAPVPPTAQWMAPSDGSAATEFADGFAQSVVAPDQTAELSPLDAQALLAFRGLTKEQQREVIAAMERTRQANQRIVTELSGIAAGAQPAVARSADVAASERFERPPLRPYPAPFESGPQPPTQSAESLPPRRERPPLRPYPSDLVPATEKPAVAPAKRAKRGG
jgi:hypothetical protein